MKPKILRTLLLLMLCQQSKAISGNAVVFKSPDGIAEKCIVTTKIDGGIYTEKDLIQESKLCGLSFYDNTKIALCPKYWSTTGATIIQDISALNTSAAQFEPNCPRTKEKKPEGLKSAAKFKQAISQDGTSSISAKGILANYHLSRYFGFKIKIPAVVFREMSLKQHLNRVTKIAVTKAYEDYNKVSWNFYLRAEQNPSGSQAQKFFVNKDLNSIYGVMYKDVGQKYSLDFIGSEDADGGNEPFLSTAPFRALKSNEPLLKAIRTGNSKTGKSHSDLQMALWMRDLSEITLIDFILGQEDRIGNIDFLWKWYYVQDGVVKTRDEKSSATNSKLIATPNDIAQFNPILVKETQMSDNDESVLDWSPENYARQGGALKSISHFSLEVYKKLHNLVSNFDSGANYSNYFKSVLNFSDSDLSRLRQFTKEAYSILNAKCKAKNLRFDLDQVENILVAEPKEISINCDSPSSIN